MNRLLSMLPERLRWVPHNVIAHPLSELLWQLGARRASDWVHDSTVPHHVPVDKEGA
jgi:hypothetical protein